MTALVARVRGAVEAIRARHPEARVAAVTHGGLIASVLCDVLALGPNAVWRLRIDNTSITRVGWPARRRLSLDDTAHLGEPA